MGRILRIAGVVALALLLASGVVAFAIMIGVLRP